jgi:predicted TIM-barrel fold metal-dependent hydrolase
VVIDVHCHVGFTRLPVAGEGGRFAFERGGAEGAPGLDSYMSPRMMRSVQWRVISRMLGIRARNLPGDELDRAIAAVNERHLLGAPGIDRFVLLAFDEYHAAGGTAVGPIARRGDVGSDLYVSNSLVRRMCTEHPEKFLFGASIHPYRPGAQEALEEVRAAGAVLVKWLPVHQNIDPRDPRVEAFVRRAGALGIALLVHYGGEISLSPNHREQEDPRPMLALLERLRQEGPIPPVIIAHLATPSLPFQLAVHHRALVAALLGALRDAPVYADLSALTQRPHWLIRALKHRALHAKLVYGSDFPIPPAMTWFAHRLRGRWRDVHHPSWAERTYRIVRALGFPDEVFHRGAKVLGIEAPAGAR